MSTTGRKLWAAVVLQARDDLDTAKYGSTKYITAKSFFTANGAWAESRQDIADELELHPDDLMRLGRATLAARHLRDGPEPVSVSPGLPTPVPTRPVLRLTNPAPVGPKAPWPTITATMPAPEPVKPKRKPGRPRRLPVIEPPAAKPPRQQRHLTPPQPRHGPREVRDREWWIARFLAKNAA